MQISAVLVECFISLCCAIEHVYGHFERCTQHLLIFSCVIRFAPLRLDWDPRKARDATRALDFTGDNSVTWLQNVASLSSFVIKTCNAHGNSGTLHTAVRDLSKQGPLFRVLGSATLKQEIL